MSVLKAKTNPSNIQWKKHALPAYIIFSIAFILYTTYSYMQNVVYRGGYFAWQEQAVPVAQKQWYDAAISELITTLDWNCQTLTLNLWEASVGVLNAACVQRESTPQQSTTPADVNISAE